jgi:hypothetical protein
VQERHVARIYAGILGSLAMLTALADGLLHSRDRTSVVWLAWGSLWGFAAAGYVIGWLGQRIVQESVEAALRAELAEHEQSEDRVGTGG